MDLLQEGVRKLKEIVFMKKGTGQACEAEEAALKSLEDQAGREEAERQACLEAADKKAKELDVDERRIDGLKEKLIGAARAWQKAATEVFRAERQAEELFDEVTALRKQAGSKERFPCYKKRSIYHGSQRARWIDEELDTLTEDFRRDLILDNREFYGEKRGRPRKRKKLPDPSPKFNFAPEQYETLLDNGIEPPNWMRSAYVAHKKELKKILASQPYKVTGNV